ncbi:MAG: c-type cytochrome [Gemmatimonadota bacterium]
MFDPVGIIVLIVAVAGFGWITKRAWRVQRLLPRLGGVAIAGVLTLACTAVLVLALRGYWKLNRGHPNPVPEVSVSPTPERRARGEQLAGMCAGCHTADGEPPLEGSDFLGEDAPPIGRFYAPNLTPTHLSEWSDGEIIRAIREGIHRSGRSLLLMPSETFRNLNDYDVESVVAFLREQPAVEPDTPDPHLNVLGAVLVNFAPIFTAQPPVIGTVTGPEPGATPEYGRYIASITCAACHGEDLRGNTQFEVPSLIGAALTWSEEQFGSFFRTGVKPGGLSVADSVMPWSQLGELMGAEGISAVVLYLGEEFPTRPDSLDNQLTP